MRAAAEVQEAIDREQTNATFFGLRVRQALRAKPVGVHGLKELQGEEIERALPFRMTLSDGQGVFTCVCASGWVSVCPKADSKAAFDKHLEDVRNPSTV